MEVEQYSAVITEGLTVSSSHEIYVPAPYNGDKLFDENYIHELREPTEYEKELLKGTKTVSELLEEERKESEKKFQELTEEEKLKAKRTEIITKVKVVSLDELDKHPLCNPSFFTTRDKRRLIEKMEENLKLSEDELNFKFNRVCNEVLFSPEADFEKYTVYNSSNNKV